MPAPNIYWVSPIPSFWDTTNWSYTSGGPAGAPVPGPGDIAIFDSSSIGRCVMNVPVDIAGLHLQWGFPTTLNQGAYPIRIGGKDASFDGGFFRGSNQDIVVEGSFSLTASEFKSTSGTLSVQNGFYFYDATVVPESIGTIYSDEFYLSPLDIENKYVTLVDDPTPDPADPESPYKNVAVNILGGSSQYEGTDFFIDENLLRWNGMALESRLSAGDTLRVSYHAGYEPGTFVHRNGKVQIRSTNHRFHGGGARFYDLEFTNVEPGLNYTSIDSSCYVSHYLFLTGGGLTQGIDGTIHLSGDMTGSQYFGSKSPANNALIDMTATFSGGSPLQRIHWEDGAIFPSITVNKYNPNQLPYREVIAAGPGGDLRFRGNFTVQDGTFNLNNHHLKVGDVL
jgi:hypothetical protein